MNYRGSMGLALRKVLDRAMSRAWFPPTRYVRPGVNPWYDMQRFAGRKAFDCIFDVGANIGQTARQLLLYFPQSRIYSFEPASDTFQQLTGLSRLHPNLHCVNCALGSRAGDGQMAVYADSELNTFRPDAARWGPPARTDVVTIDTLDRFCEARSIGSIDILNMGVQGSELGLRAPGSEPTCGRSRKHRELTGHGPHNFLPLRAISDLHRDDRHGHEPELPGLDPS